MTLRDIEELMGISGDRDIKSSAGETKDSSALGDGVTPAGAMPVAYRFADCRLLAQHTRLERDGVAVPLTTKLYHLLVTFLKAPGEVLSKKQIVDAVWPGQVVTDAALVKQIQRLRQVLNDADRDPPLIETHRGLGYRLTCPVAVDYESPRNTSTTSAAKGNGRRLLKTACLGLVASLAAVSIGLIINRESTTPLARESDITELAASQRVGPPSEGCHQAVSQDKHAGVNQATGKGLSLEQARCRLQQGDAHGAVAVATAVYANAEPQDHDTRVDARLLAARAYMSLGTPQDARNELNAAITLTEETRHPSSTPAAIEARALLAGANGNWDQAYALHEERLELAELSDYGPQYLARVNLDLATSAAAMGDYGAVRGRASDARSLAEESGDKDLLLGSYQALIMSYFRDNSIDAAVQLSLAARPLLNEGTQNLYAPQFMQFAALALNMRGLFDEARAYTERLRALEAVSPDPMHGAMADLTVMHRLYVQGEFEDSYVLAKSSRARLEALGRSHSALPEALATEALAAARGGAEAEAIAIIERINRDYGASPYMQAAVQRARGHLLIRNGDPLGGIESLRRAEEGFRSLGVIAVADYVGVEAAQQRLEYETLPPWDDLERLTDAIDFEFLLSMTLARAHMREGNCLGAMSALQEAKLRGNDLWSTEGQLLQARCEAQQSQRAGLAKLEDPPSE